MLSLINVLLKLCAFSHKCTVPSLLSPVNCPRFYILCWITKKLSPQCSKITWRSAYKSSLSSWSRCHGIWLLLFLCVMVYGFYFFMRHGMALTFFMCHGMAFTFLCVMVWLLLFYASWYGFYLLVCTYLAQKPKPTVYRCICPQPWDTEHFWDSVNT